MRFQLHRFDCMTNYVHLIGSSQDCERVLLNLHDRAQELTARTNTLQRAFAQATNQYEIAVSRAHEYAAAYASATNALAVAQAKAAKFTNLREWLEEQRDKALLQTTKKIYQAILDRMEE